MRVVLTEVSPLSLSAAWVLTVPCIQLGCGAKSKILLLASTEEHCTQAALC